MTPLGERIYWTRRAPPPDEGVAYAGPGWLDRLEAQAGPTRVTAIWMGSTWSHGEYLTFGRIRRVTPGVIDWLAGIDAAPIGLPRDDAETVMRWSLS